MTMANLISKGVAEGTRNLSAQLNRRLSRRVGAGVEASNALEERDARFGSALSRSAQTLCLVLDQPNEPARRGIERQIPLHEQAHRGRGHLLADANRFEQPVGDTQCKQRFRNSGDEIGLRRDRDQPWNGLAANGPSRRG